MGWRSCSPMEGYRMTRLKMSWQILVFCTMGAPLVAQTQIGGGSCTSASLSGSYSVSITGRQVTAAGTFTNVMQAIGSATFDGQNKVSFTLTADTPQSVGSPLAWSGTYSIQANCAGAIAVTSGGSASLNLVAFNQGNNILLTGNDSTYFYSGSGNTVPNSCSTALLSG